MELFILDENFRSLHTIDVFESLIWTERYNGYGDFEFYTPMSQDILEVVNAIQKRMENLYDCYVYLKDTGGVMVIEDLEITTDAESGDRLTITGRGLESLLERRIVWDKTTLNSKLQYGVNRLINESIINPNISERRIPGFIFKESSDEYINNLTIRAQYTGDNLYEAILAICSTNNLGFDVTLNSDNQFEFMLTYGADRSYSQSKNPYVVFSTKFENIVSSDYLESGKTLKTITLVAGEGEGTERTRVTVGNGSGLQRKELYTDARDIQTETYSQELEEDQEQYETYKQELEQLEQELSTERDAFLIERNDYREKQAEYVEKINAYKSRIPVFQQRIEYYNHRITEYYETLDYESKLLVDQKNIDQKHSDSYQRLIDSMDKGIDDYNDVLNNQADITYDEIVSREGGIRYFEKMKAEYEELKKPFDEAVSEAEKQIPGYETELKDLEEWQAKYQKIVENDQNSLDEETEAYKEATEEYQEKETAFNETETKYQQKIESVSMQMIIYEMKIADDQKALEELYADLLVQRGTEKLSEKTYTKAFTGEVDSVSTFVYGSDFFKGDIVQIINEYGMESKVRVSEIIRAQDLNGYKTYPTFEVIE